MPTQSATDISDMFDDLYDYLGIDLQITRGVNPPASVAAIKGEYTTTRFGEDQMYGSALVGDFIVKASEYTSQVGGPPERFDSIDWVDDLGITRTAQVGVDGVERQYDPADHTGILWRIHTSEIA